MNFRRSPGEHTVLSSPAEFDTAGSAVWCGIAELNAVSVVSWATLSAENQKTFPILYSDAQRMYAPAGVRLVRACVST